LPEFGWDKGLDFKDTRKLLSDALVKLRALGVEVGRRTSTIERIGENVDPRLFKSRMVNLCVLLTQLVNGARVSEAYDSIFLWALDGRRENQVRVRKHRFPCTCSHSKQAHPDPVTRKLTGACQTKKGCAQKCLAYVPDRSKVDMRLMVIPPEIPQEDREAVRQGIEGGTSLDAVKVWVGDNLNFNSHSLRYSDISYLGTPPEQGGLGKSPQIIAKQTHQTKVDLIVRYTQQKVADAMLRDVVGVSTSELKEVKTPTPQGPEKPKVEESKT
jgi:hypothetical protein